MSELNTNQNNQSPENEITLSDIPIMPVRSKVIRPESSHTTSEFGDMPLVVQLKGDEAFFGEFDLSADEAMQILGIKRSRLNQISGKDLRVGRAKIDRYIRPIYRSKDINDYLKWSRTTATQKKSQEVIDEATSKLLLKAEELSKLLSQENGVLTKTLADHQKAFVGSLADFSNKTLHSQTGATKRIISFLREETRSVKIKLEEHSESINRITEKMRCINDTQKLMFEGHNEQASKLLHIKEDISSFKNSVEESVNQLNQSFTEIISDSHRIALEHDKKVDKLINSIQSLTKETSEWCHAIENKVAKVSDEICNYHKQDIMKNSTPLFKPNRKKSFRY